MSSDNDNSVPDEQGAVPLPPQFDDGDVADAEAAEAPTDADADAGDNDAEPVYEEDALADFANGDDQTDDVPEETKDVVADDEADEAPDVDEGPLAAGFAGSVNDDSPPPPPAPDAGDQSEAGPQATAGAADTETTDSYSGAELNLFARMKGQVNSIGRSVGSGVTSIIDGISGGSGRDNDGDDGETDGNRRWLRIGLIVLAVAFLLAAAGMLAVSSGLFSSNNDKADSAETTPSAPVTAVVDEEAVEYCQSDPANIPTGMLVYGDDTPSEITSGAPRGGNTPMTASQLRDALVDDQFVGEGASGCTAAGTAYWGLSDPRIDSDNLGGNDPASRIAFYKQNADEHREVSQYIAETIADCSAELVTLTATDVAAGAYFAVFNDRTYSDVVWVKMDLDRLIGSNSAADFGIPVLRCSMGLVEGDPSGIDRHFMVSIGTKTLVALESPAGKVVIPAPEPDPTPDPDQGSDESGEGDAGMDDNVVDPAAMNNGQDDGNRSSDPGDRELEGDRDESNETPKDPPKETPKEDPKDDPPKETPREAHDDDSSFDWGNLEDDPWSDPDETQQDDPPKETQQDDPPKETPKEESEDDPQANPEDDPQDQPAAVEDDPQDQPAAPPEDDPQDQPGGPVQQPGGGDGGQTGPVDTGNGGLIPGQGNNGGNGCGSNCPGDGSGNNPGGGNGCPSGNCPGNGGNGGGGDPVNPVNPVDPVDPPVDPVDPVDPGCPPGYITGPNGGCKAPPPNDGVDL